MNKWRYSNKHSLLAFGKNMMIPVIRFATSWATKEKDIDALLALL